MDVPGFSVQQVDEWLSRSDNASEWARLQGVLSLTEGFAFLAVHTDDESAERLVGGLLTSNGESQGIHVHGSALLLDPTSASPVVTLLLQELSDAPRPCWFFFRGGPHARQSRAELARACLLFNQKRDVIAKQADAPFILALHPEDWRVFRRNAPDFWSIHQAVFRFGAAELSKGTSDIYRIEGQSGAMGENARVGDFRPSQQHAPSGWRLFGAGRKEVIFGRQSERRYLSAKLREMGSRVLVRGVAGIGKSTLVRSVLADVFDRYDEGIWWVPFGELSGTPDDRARAALGGLIADLVPLTHFPSGLTERATLFRHLTENRRMLFVFDDVDDDSLFRWIVPSEMASVCVITRAPGPWFGFDELDLGSLSTEESQRLMRKMYPRLPDEVVRELAEASGGVPLMLQLLGAYVGDSADPKERAGRALSQLGPRSRPIDLQSASRLLDGVLSESISPAAAALWSVLALFDGPFTGEDIAAVSQTPIAGVTALLSELASAALVTRVAEDEFKLHPVLRREAQLRLNRSERAFEVEERFLQRAISSGHIESTRVGEVWISLLSRSLDRADDQVQSVLRSLDTFLSFAEPSERAGIAESVTEAAGRQPDLRVERVALFGLLVSLSRLGHFEEALAAGRRLAPLIARDSPGQQLAVFTLTARAARLSGHLEEAESILGEALTRADAAGEEDAEALVEAARISLELGNYDQAQERATKADVLAGGSDFAPLAVLADLASHRGSPNEAAALWSKVVARAEQAQERDAVFRALNGQADAYVRAGFIDRGIETYLQAARVAQELGSQGGYAYVQTALGQLEERRGNSRSALQFFDRALEAYRALSERDAIRSLLRSRAVTLERLGDREAAIDSATASLSGAPETPDASRSHALLARLLFPEEPDNALAHVRAMVDAFARASESDRREHAEVLIKAAKSFLDAGMRDAADLLTSALLAGSPGEDLFARQMRVQAHLYRLRILSENGGLEALDRYLALARDELVAVLGDSSVDEFAASLREAAGGGASR